jgi:gliding motility-associated-like protein
MPELIDSRHNEIQCFIPQESDVNYYWDFGDGEQDSLKNAVNHKYTALTQMNELKTITLRAVNGYGCDSVAYRTVVVGPFFPNVFTPNADGINDKFLTGIDVLITDRYGLIVYKGNEGWNGKFRNSGKDLPPDTYFFYANYTDPYGVPKTRKGFVTLIR